MVSFRLARGSEDTPRTRNHSRNKTCHENMLSLSHTGAEGEGSLSKVNVSVASSPGALKGRVMRIVSAHS